VSDTRYNWMLGLALAVGIALATVFLVSLTLAKGGEIAGALGSLIGGMVGAAGAVWAVFLALSRQREEETHKVADAVRLEVTALVKYLIGAVEACQQIARNEVLIPRQDAGVIAKVITAGAIVFPAVADRIGLLPHPQATVEFYLRMAEAKAATDMLRARTDPLSATYVSPPPDYVTPEAAASLADILITALQVAKPIVGNARSVDAGSKSANAYHSIILKQIDQCLVSAKASFPHSECFATDVSLKQDC
jgi:hypothetical protein